MKDVIIVCGWEFFNAGNRWHSRSHYGPSWLHIVRRKAEEIKARGIECQVTRENWGHRDYAIIFPLEGVRQA